MPRWRFTLWTVAIGVVVAAIYILRLDAAAGMTVDDAWYMVLAKSLAEGNGYRLISSATAQIQPAVPPGFPIVLSPIFKLFPSFPENVIWLKVPSLLAMFLVGPLCYLDYVRHRALRPEQALLLVTAVLITPAFVFLATSTVMAECVFTLAQVAAVFLIERVTRSPASPARTIAAGVTAAIAMLVRTTGLAVIVAGLVHLLIQRRRRDAALFAVTAVVAIAPWQLYSLANQPTYEERLSHGGTIAFSYSQLVAMNAVTAGSFSEAPLAARAARIAPNVAGVFGRDVGAVLMPILYRGPYESGQEVVSVGGFNVQITSMGNAAGTWVISLLLSAVAIVGWLASGKERFGLPALVTAATLAMISIVDASSFRYVVPLTPFLLLFFWRGIVALTMKARRIEPTAAARIAVLTFVGFNLADHAFYINQKLSATTEWVANAAEVDELLTWMSTHVTEPGGVASNNPGLVYLRTGRKGVSADQYERNWSRWQSEGMRYVVSLRRANLPREFLKTRTLFQTGRRRLWIVEM